jgi:secondary thiamine-phosphate synthase enzyme
MSKSSTVTVRENPVEAVASVKAGGLTIHGETFVVQTEQRVEVVDLTNRIMEFVRASNIREGFVSLWSMHTTCTLFINEFQTALLDDVAVILQKLIPRRSGYRHDDPRYSDCDRANAHAHLRATLLGRSIALGVADRAILLGQYQRVILAELDGPRDRHLQVQVLGD